MRDEKLFVADILERIELIEEFVQPGREAFSQSRLIQEAVVRSFEVLGEAIRNVSKELRDKHPEVPWQKVSGFRNFLIHVYWSVDIDRVWEIIHTDLPPLKPQIEAILRELESQSPDENTQDNGE